MNLLLARLSIEFSAALWLNIQAKSWGLHGAPFFVWYSDFLYLVTLVSKHVSIFFNLTRTILISLKCSLHKVAADLALEATYLFLSDVRSTVGDDIFAKFLNLKSDESMALVIDVSGSMSGESFKLSD